MLLTPNGVPSVKFSVNHGECDTYFQQIICIFLNTGLFVQFVSISPKPLAAAINCKLAATNAAAFPSVLSPISCLSAEHTVKPANTLACCHCEYGAMLTLAFSSSDCCVAQPHRSPSVTENLYFFF